MSVPPETETETEGKQPEKAGDGHLPHCMTLRGNGAAVEEEENSPDRFSQCTIMISDVWSA